MDNGFTPSQSAEPFTLATAPAGAAAASHRQGRAAWLGIPGSWPLVVILAVQILLSLRLVRADTAFQDEAAYLWAGHMELAHWLHGASIPPFPSYFSGAPVIYPPIAALADNLGGLTAARILSLIFMLGATTLLWSTSSRLFGQRAAFFATALFAILGPTVHLGAFATYDALSVFLIALATWLVVRAGDRQDATGWMIAAGVVLALANATAYSSILFDVIVILLALLLALPALGRRLAVTRALTILIIVVVLLMAGALIGGSSYIRGFDATTFARVAGGASALTVVGDAWAWTGFVVVAALFGVAVSWMNREGTARTLLLAVMAVAALLGPLEQAQLHTAASLNKHVGLGAWFAAIAAGYAVDKLIAAVPAGSTRAVTCGACVVALALPIALGAEQSRNFSTSWPDSTSFVAIFGPIVQHNSGPLLVEDPSVAEYYLHATEWTRWSSTRNIVKASGVSTGGPGAAGIVGAGNAGTFGTYIEHAYFSIVALNFIDTTSLDQTITSDLKLNRHYCVLQVVPYGIEIPPIGVGTYVIWRHEPQLTMPSRAHGWNCP